VSDSYQTTAPLSIPESNGAIIRYDASFGATGRVAIVGQANLAAEFHKYWETSGETGVEGHFAPSFPPDYVPSPLVVGVDCTLGRSCKPEIGFGSFNIGSFDAGAFWSGDEFGAEVKLQGHGVEVSAEFSGAGDMFVVTDGATYNYWGAAELGRQYVNSRDIMYLEMRQFGSYPMALRYMLWMNLIQQRQTGFPFEWVATGQSEAN
jgi:hypothetical protein